MNIVEPHFSRDKNQFHVLTKGIYGWTTCFLYSIVTPIFLESILKIIISTIKKKNSQNCHCYGLYVSWIQKLMHLSNIVDTASAIRHNNIRHC